MSKISREVWKEEQKDKPKTHINPIFVESVSEIYQKDDSTFEFETIERGESRKYSSNDKWYLDRIRQDFINKGIMVQVI